MFKYNIWPSYSYNFYNHVYFFLYKITLHKGTHQIFSQYDDENMLGSFGNLFVKCMQQITKGHWYHLFGVSDHCEMYRQRAQSAL